MSVASVASKLDAADAAATLVGVARVRDRERGNCEVSGREKNEPGTVFPRVRGRGSGG